MDSEHTANRVPSVSPIPTTLKRKRGPSISGDPPSGKPVLKQSKDASAEALADLDELEEVDDEEYDSDSSGNNESDIPSVSPLPSTDTSQASLILPDDEDATQLRARLREIGPPAFEKECLETKQMDLRAVGTMLGVPRELAGHDDEEYLGFLRGMMLYITSKRAKLEHINTIDDAASLIKTRSKILVITGAGISTSLGIPDFRSKDTGFYAKLKEMGMAEPEEVFDIFNFDYDPQTFYSLAGDILPSGKAYTPTHAFIRALQDQHRLQTNYTQNIDNLEGLAGISPDRLIQCHGSFATASCRKCKHQVPGDTIFASIRAKTIATCGECERKIAAGEPLVDAAAAAAGAKAGGGARKKSPKFHYDDDSSSSDEDADDDIPTAGVMKPDITFFGEDLPNTFFSRFNSLDCGAADLVVVIGTSMQVAPVAKMPDKLAQAGREDVPCIYIGREPCNHIEFDVQLIGDCDAVVWELARRAGWELRHEMIPVGGLELEVREMEGEKKGRWTVTRKGAGGSGVVGV